MAPLSVGMVVWTWLGFIVKNTVVGLGERRFGGGQGGLHYVECYRLILKGGKIARKNDDWGLVLSHSFGNCTHHLCHRNCVQTPPHPHSTC